MMRVPLKVALPWQIFGSATMYSPSSTRYDRPFRLAFIVQGTTLLYIAPNCKAAFSPDSAKGLQATSVRPVSSKAVAIFRCTTDYKSAGLRYVKATRALSRPTDLKFARPVLR